METGKTDVRIDEGSLPFKDSHSRSSRSLHHSAERQRPLRGDIKGGFFSSKMDILLGVGVCLVLRGRDCASRLSRQFFGAHSGRITVALGNVKLIRFTHGSKIDDRAGCIERAGYKTSKSPMTLYDGNVDVGLNALIGLNTSALLRPVLTVSPKEAGAYSIPDVVTSHPKLSPSIHSCLTLFSRPDHLHLLGFRSFDYVKKR